MSFLSFAGSEGEAEVGERGDVKEQEIKRCKVAGGCDWQGKLIIWGSLYAHVRVHAIG